jgi:hypothetical protein
MFITPYHPAWKDAQFDRNFVKPDLFPGTGSYIIITTHMDFGFLSSQALVHARACYFTIVVFSLKHSFSVWIESSGIERFTSRANIGRRPRPTHYRERVDGARSALRRLAYRFTMSAIRTCGMSNRKALQFCVAHVISRSIPPMLAIDVADNYFKNLRTGATYSRSVVPAATKNWTNG